MKVYITLECTPADGRKGMTKLVGKDWFGKILFTTFYFHRFDLLIQYSEEGQLEAYVHGCLCYNRQHTAVMNLINEKI